MDLPGELPTEAANPSSEGLDRLSPVELVRIMNSEDRVAVEAVERQAEAIADAISEIADRLDGGGRLFYVGSGTSGRLGVLDAVECPPTFNTDPELVQGLIAGGESALVSSVEGAEDDPSAGAADLRQRGLRAGDAVVGIAASGTTPYVLGAVGYARELGVWTAGISCNEGAPLSQAVACPITVVVGPEVLAGSTRLKAGTATKLVLNTLSTGVMVRLGRTYGNLMVDLRASNVKLRGRARRLLAMLTGLNGAEGEELLDRCGGELKVAVLVARLGVDVDAARRRLQDCSGHLRRALGQ